MKEYLIAIEGEDTGDGRIILPGALKLPDGPIPIVDRRPGSYEGELVGSATLVRREGGDIYATFSFDELPPDRWPCIDVYPTLQWSEDEKSSWALQSGELRAIFLGDNPSWPDRIKGQK